MSWTSEPPKKPGQFWLRGPGFTTSVVTVYEGVKDTPGGKVRRLEASHPSFGHMALTSPWMDGKEWGPEVTLPA